MKKDKLFILRKYVKAENVHDAIQRSKKVGWDDVYVSDDWKEGKINTLAYAIGFDHSGFNKEKEE